jgi:hypothetical protein
MKVLIEEKEKSEEKQNKSLINQLSKTITENSILGEFGMAVPVLSRINSVLSTNYFDSEKDTDDQEVKSLIDNAQNIKSEFYLEIDNEDNSRKCNESQKVF